MASCKSSLPREKIRAVLEGQILPRFTNCFMQAEEGVAPDGGSLDGWLQDITTDMQKSIEKHLANVFQE